MFFILFTVLIMMLSFILLFLGNFLSFKEKMDREKLSPFECGFTPKFSARLPFSLRFFMICIVFLLFDVELILLFPIVSTFMTSYSIFSYFILIITLMVLFFGLLHEIFLGCLNWAN